MTARPRVNNPRIKDRPDTVPEIAAWMKRFHAKYGTRPLTTSTLELDGLVAKSLYLWLNSSGRTQLWHRAARECGLVNRRELKTEQQIWEWAREWCQRTRRPFRRADRRKLHGVSPQMVYGNIYRRDDNSDRCVKLFARIRMAQDQGLLNGDEPLTPELIDGWFRKKQYWEHL